jgi:superfamily I DNA and/or RNA helicase
MLGPESDNLPFDLQHRHSAVFLTVNYRGHASFLMMPSSLFYFDKLEVVDGHSTTDWISKLRCVEALSKPVTELALKWNQCSVSSVSAPGWSARESPILQFRRQETWPIHFRGVVGHDTAVAIEAFAGSDSWCNLQEAETVFQIVSALVANGVKTSSIGIMSPFRGQVTLIRRLLRAANLDGVDVGRIEDYQAVERDVIVLSLTRSDEKFVANDVASRAGVFNQVKRTNVSLTRAEHLFIVVGNPNLMVKDLIWRQWLWFCLRNGVWYGEQVDHTWLDELQVNPINLKPFRSGETHALLVASSNERENSVLMSSMERNRRFCSYTYSFFLYRNARTTGVMTRYIVWIEESIDHNRKCWYDGIRIYTV